MEYDHGSRASERSTAILTVVSAGANITFAVGTAPINLVDETNVNKLCRLANYEDAVQQFGFDKDFNAYSLSEVIQVFFKLYKTGPVFFVNVLDPVKHKKSAEQETQTQVNSRVVLSQLGAIKSSVKVKVAAADKVLDADYSLSFNEDNQLVISVLSGGSIKPADKLIIDYDVLDYSKVTAKDIIGGIDSNGDYSGIELVQQCYPKYNEVVGSLIAPGWSHDLTVAAALLANSKSMNEVFIANALVDLDTSKMKVYSDAVDIKAKANLTDPLYNVCMGDVIAGGVKYHQSTFLAAVKQYITHKNDDFPNQNPSNKPCYCDGYQINGKDIFLDRAQSNFLNKNGIIVVRKFSSGWRIWGNRTACFPANTDVKDYDIAVRDCGNYLRNTVIVTTEQQVDETIDRAYILRIENTLQSWLDSLIGARKLINASIKFPKEKNSLSDLLAGNIYFELDYTTGTTASSITISIGFNVGDLNLIFTE